MSEKLQFTPIQLNTDSKKNIVLATGISGFNPVKSIPAFGAIANSLGIQATKSLIITNTLNLFNSSQGKSASNFNFPSSSGATMPILGKSDLGFPVFSNLFIAAGDYQDNNGNTIGRFSDITLNAVLMEMESENVLKVTEIQGGTQSVIEMVGRKSSMVHVTCSILAKTPGVYPIDDVTNLAIALASNKPLIVDAWFLSMRGIYAMVVKKDSIKQEEGAQDSQKFEFDCMADKPLILKLKR